MHRASDLVAKVRDHKNLVRALSNKAVLNSDCDSLDKYREDRDRVRRLDRLEADMSEIKSLLTRLLEKNNH
jgi:hypothetical protein